MWYHIWDLRIQYDDASGWCGMVKANIEKCNKIDQTWHLEGLSPQLTCKIVLAGYRQHAGLRMAQTWSTRRAGWATRMLHLSTTIMRPLWETHLLDLKVILNLSFIRNTRLLKPSLQCCWTYSPAFPCLCFRLTSAEIVTQAIVQMFTPKLTGLNAMSNLTSTSSGTSMPKLKQKNMSWK